MISGIVGLIIVSVGVWLKRELRDVLFIVGGALLLWYSYSIGSLIFMILQVIFMLSAIVNLLIERHDSK